MCGRYVHPDQAAIERVWHIGRQTGTPFPRRFNVAPTSIVPILRWDAQTHSPVLAHAYWGFVPPWWKEAKPPRHTINARSEGIAVKPMWRNAFRQGRCLIPAEGWYEWRVEDRADPQTGEISSIKQPYFIRTIGGGIVCFAGIFSVRTPDPATMNASCAIITRASEGAAAQVHDRMPVVLPNDAMQAWLDPSLKDPSAMIERNARSDMECIAVSTRVNQRAAEGVQLIEPLARHAG
jgi:putative SOS response-associated peptidase YedK